MKILVEQEGIDINAKNKAYFDNLIFQNNVWNLFKLFRTSLIKASENGRTETVKILKYVELANEVNATLKFKQK